MEKADSSSVLPCPVSISTKNKMNFLFANLKDRDLLVQRISDFLQRTPESTWGDTNPMSLIGSSVRPSPPGLRLPPQNPLIKLLLLSRPPLTPPTRGAITTRGCRRPGRVCCSCTTGTPPRTWDPKR